MQYEKDIKVWTRDYAVKIVRNTSIIKGLGVDYSLRDQLLRSGTSIGANVREAKHSSSRRELIRFYEISLRSAEETAFWMDVICRGYDLSKEVFLELEKELDEISRIIAQIIINLKK